MKTVESFQINHEKLEPGIYERKLHTYESAYGEVEIKIFDLRFMRPNRETPIGPSALHTIEHLASIYFRNHPIWNKAFLHFSPMGCRTGFYLTMKTIFGPRTIRKLIIGMCEFIINFDGPIPHATARECGNYRGHDLEVAKNYVAKYKKELESNFHDKYPI